MGTLDQSLHASGPGPHFQPLYLSFQCWEQAEEQPQEALPEPSYGTSRFHRLPLWAVKLGS